MYWMNHQVPNGMLLEAQAVFEWLTYLMQKAFVQVLLALKSTALTDYRAGFFEGSWL